MNLSISLTSGVIAKVAFKVLFVPLRAAFTTADEATLILYLNGCAIAKFDLVTDPESASKNVRCLQDRRRKNSLARRLDRLSEVEMTSQLPRSDESLEVFSVSFNYHSKPNGSIFHYLYFSYFGSSSSLLLLPHHPAA